jgi:hypothetical protein
VHSRTKDRTVSEEKREPQRKRKESETRKDTMSHREGDRERARPRTPRGNKSAEHVASHVQSKAIIKSVICAETPRKWRRGPCEYIVRLEGGSGLVRVFEALDDKAREAVTAEATKQIRRMSTVPRKRQAAFGEGLSSGCCTGFPERQLELAAPGSALTPLAHSRMIRNGDASRRGVPVLGPASVHGDGRRGH